MRWLLLLVPLLFVSCKDRPASVAEKAGRLFLTGTTETSGLATSLREDGLLWIHNDSKGQAVLQAIGTDGRPRGKVRIDDTKNIHWEDVASFKLDGTPWLLIADTGDNAGKRNDCALLVIPEPDPASLSTSQELTAKVAWRIPVVYPDGPRDCEAVGVDPYEGKVYLVAKRSSPPVIYTLPLRLPSNGPVPKAEPIAKLHYIPRPTSAQQVLPTPTGRFRAQPTGLSISPDAHRAALLTYGDVLLFQRKTGESWADALCRAPVLLTPHGLPQAEAIGFSRDGRYLYVTGERKDALLLRYKLESD